MAERQDSSQRLGQPRHGTRIHLQQWADQEPAWLHDAPAQAFGWLGQLAADYDARRTSQLFFERCIRDGGYPRDFLLARAALQAGSGTEQDVQDYLAAYQDAQSPLLVALSAYLDRDWAGCLDQLGLWEPHDAAAEIFKVQLEAEALISADREGEALARLRAAERDGKFTSVAVRLASALVQRAARSRTSSRLADAQEALTVALRARNSRRAWHGNSAGATVLAVQAAMLCGDLARAWSLTQPRPEGEALPHEAADAGLREQSALVAAASGRVQEAERLLAGITDAFAKAQVMAVIAEFRHGGDSEDPQVRSLWRQAWGAAQSEQQQLTAAMGLAEAGADLPDLGHLRTDFSDAVAEIEQLARALREAPGAELGALRANTTRSPFIVVKLAQRHHRRGEVDLAARALKDGAEHWRDPRLMAMAAGLFREAGSYRDVRECADEALKMAGPGWAGQGRMYALLVEAESADGRMDRATDAAMTLLALDPQDPDARWALARCYATRALMDQAWQTLAENGEPLEPRTRDEALLWLRLGRFLQIIGSLVDVCR
ncbi:hypothetical protein AB0B79_37435 [Streptomyces sp. NPDC039022]|uniref:hypothetical protein n=1 Tax=Streptomyces sp. NPDC039022 TaxID=3157091 RepID=UPI0033CC1626